MELSKLELPIYLSKENFLQFAANYADYDLYDNPEIYDVAYSAKSEDYNFYESVINHYDSLYLGIGTGRLFQKLFKSNNKIIGIDNSSKMLDRFFLKHPNFTKEICQTKSALDKNSFSSNSFERIIAPHSFFSQFSIGENFRIFANIYNWLKPNGVFYWDIFSPFQNAPFQFDAEISKYYESEIYEVGFGVSYDHINQKSSECTFATNKITKEKIMLKIDLNYYYPNEILRTLSSAGFKAKMHDLSFGELTVNSEDIYFSCEKV